MEENDSLMENSETDTASQNSDTDTGDEDCGALADHSYSFTKSNRRSHESGLNDDAAKEHDYFQDKQVTRKGPLCTTKSQEDFNQIRSSKLKKVDLFTEVCKHCNESFSSRTLANMHVRKKSCNKILSVKNAPRKNVDCEQIAEKLLE